jgi:hypothetical protein
MENVPIGRKMEQIFVQNVPLPVEDVWEEIVITNDALTRKE